MENVISSGGKLLSSLYLSKVKKSRTSAIIEGSNTSYCLQIIAYKLLPTDIFLQKAITNLGIEFTINTEVPP